MNNQNPSQPVSENSNTNVIPDLVRDPESSNNSPQNSIKKPSKFSIKAIIGIIIFLLLAGGAAAGYVYREPILKLVSNTPSPTPSPIVAITPTPDPTADWKTYTNKELGFELKYPEDWLLHEKKGSKFLTIVPPGGEFFANNLDKSDMGYGIVPSIESEIIDQPFSMVRKRFENQNDCYLSKKEINTSDETSAFYCESEGAPFNEIFIALPNIENTKTLKFNLTTTYQENIDQFNRKNGTRVENADKETFKNILSTFKFKPKEAFTSDKWLNYSNNEGMYSISYPESFKINIGKFIGVDGVVVSQPKSFIQLISPQDVNLGGGNFSMEISSELTQYADLKQYIEKESTCTSILVSNGNPITLDTKSGLIYENTPCGPKGSTQIFAINNNRIYNISFSQSGNYEKVKPTYLKLLTMFKFLN